MKREEAETMQLYEIQRHQENTWHQKGNVSSVVNDALILTSTLCISKFIDHDKEFDS